MNPLSTTPAFTLDPTLPWLSSDPTMQEPAAFRDMRLLTLGNWQPMGLYFPEGTELAVRRVTSLDQLVEGAAYWHEHHYYEPARGKVLERQAFGRYTGPAYPNAPSTPRRWKKGEAHITLEADVLDCDLRSYFFREDGTDTVFADTDGEAHKLYQVTHYVSLPATYLAQLGPAAVKQSGVHLRQATWLAQERLMLTDEIVELTAHLSWSGLEAADYRVVAPYDQLADFFTIQASLEHKLLTPGVARRRKAGAVAITFRSRNKQTGLSFKQPEYYALEDATLLLDYLCVHSEAQRTSLEAAVRKQQLQQAADVVRAQRKAQQRAEEAERAAKEAQEAALALRQREGALLPRQQHQYAGLEELALAA